MARVLDRLRSFIRDRRHRDVPVAVERRAKKTRKEIDERLECALHDFEKTVRMQREDFFRFSANDAQQTVQFATFRLICKSLGFAPSLFRCLKYTPSFCFCFGV